MSTYLNAIQADAVVKPQEQKETQLSAVGFDFLRRPVEDKNPDNRYSQVLQTIYNGVMCFK